MGYACYRVGGSALLLFSFRSGWQAAVGPNLRYYTVAVSEVVLSGGNTTLDTVTGLFYIC